MTDKHLNYIIEAHLDICTNRSKKELEIFLRTELQGINNNCDVVCGELKIKDIKLCDCDNYEVENDDE